MPFMTPPSSETQAHLDFSIIVPSRNRPQLVREAVASVLAQEHPSREVIVVDDGSDEAFEAVYRELGATPGVRLVSLLRTERGHGPSYALNRGVEAARGEYVCFLDDDDSWTDPRHLARAARCLADDDSADLYLACQTAFRGDVAVTEALWLNGLPQWLDAGAAGEPAPRPVTMAQLLRCPTFAHLNTIICRRGLYLDSGGMDESIRYECEWDLYFRLIEGARRVIFYPGHVARHNVPDPSRRANVSTAVPELQKLLLRIRVMDKALLFSNSPGIRRRAGEVKTVTLKRIAEVMAGRGQWRQGMRYAAEALLPGFNLKWTAYCLYLAARALTSGSAGDGAQGASK